MAALNLLFNSYDIQTDELITSGVVHEDTGNRNLVVERRPRQERQYLVDAYWQDRTIVVTGNLVQTTKDLADTDLDTLKTNLIGTEQNLDIDYAGGTRRYKATLRSIKVNRRFFRSRMMICRATSSRRTVSLMKTTLPSSSRRETARSWGTTR